MKGLMGTNTELSTQARIRMSRLEIQRPAHRAAADFLGFPALQTTKSLGSNVSIFFAAMAH